MGIFNFLKDEERESISLRRSSKERFELSNFSNNAELIQWLEENKVILLSEKDGLVVYTNDVRENFLQLYTSTSNVVDEDLSEYVEITGGDLRSLLSEMPDITYLILNPSQENILIQRPEILNSNHMEEAYSTQSEKSEDLEMTKVISVPFSVDREGKNMINTEEPLNIDFSSSSDYEELMEEEFSESLTEEQLELLLEDEISNDDDLVLMSEEEKEFEDDDLVLMSEEEKEFEDEDLSLFDDNLEEDSFSDQLKYSKEELFEEDSKFKVVSQIPQSIIQNILKLSKEVNKFYLAENSESDELFFLLGTKKEISLDDDLFGVKVLVKDGSEEAFEIEDKKYLIFDSKQAKKLSTTYSETATMAHFKEMPIIYPSSSKESFLETKELMIFTDFSQIPDLFLNAFESFELSSIEKFRDFLTQNPEIELVRLNPFTKTLVLKPVAFESQKVEITEENYGKIITVHAEKGNQSLISLLQILSDFKLSNITISKNEKKFTFEFAAEKDVTIARQILKLKTKYQID
ncbi:MAG: hypothetical protein ACK5LM_07420 [Lactovum sp.]